MMALSTTQQKPMHALSLRLAHLYPDQMNIYGDRGNIIALVQRARWRNITLDVHPIHGGAPAEWEQFDMAFFGGGQDSGQSLIANDLLHHQAAGLSHAIEHGLVMLAICGGYQLLGHYFLTHTGERLPGIGILDVHTVGGKQRMIGNTVIALNTHALDITPHVPHHTHSSTHKTPLLVGFENHSGRTYHGAGVAPLGTVLVGYGDNGEDSHSGALYRNTIGCYLHGALLPKNPHLADYLLLQAIRRRYGEHTTLPAPSPPDEDTLEWRAHHTMIQRLFAQQKGYTS